MLRLRWPVGGLLLVALSGWMASLTGAAGTVLASAGITLGVVGLLWWLWKREQRTSPSPISEYLALGYGWALYSALLFAIPESGDRWIDWLIIIPPISVLPPLVKLAVHRLRQRMLPPGVSRALHLFVAAAFFAAFTFLVLTVLAIVVSPIPLVAGVLHVAAARFYARFT